MLANDRVGADHELGIFAGELEVLGLMTDRSEGKDVGVGADVRPAGDDDVGSEFDSVR